MTTGRRSRRSFKGGRRRVPTTWEQVRNEFTMATPASQTILDISQLQISGGTTTGGTVVRSIGNAYFSSTVAGEESKITAGICVVTKDAFIAGAVPDPNSDLEHDWYFWKANWFSFDLLGEVRNFIWDNRTARLLREGYRLVFVVHKDLTEGAINVFIAIRNLWKLRP